MDNSFSTIQVGSPTPPEMEFKYLVVGYIPGQQAIRVADISEDGFPTTGFNMLLKQGWRPVRELQFGGGGDSVAMSLLVLMEREKAPPALVKQTS